MVIYLAMDHFSFPVFLVLYQKGFTQLRNRIITSKKNGTHLLIQVVKFIVSPEDEIIAPIRKLYKNFIHL